MSGDRDPALFAARLRPHRSLGRRSFKLLLFAFLSANLFTSVPFLLFGAWPVAGFLGLDVLIFYVAFQSNFRAARAYEDVELTAFELRLAKVSAKGKRAEWRFNPAFVRLDREEDEEFGTVRLALVSRGQSVEWRRVWGRAKRRTSPGRSPAPWPRRGADRAIPDRATNPDGDTTRSKKNAAVPISRNGRTD